MSVAEVSTRDPLSKLRINREPRRKSRFWSNALVTLLFLGSFGGVGYWVWWQYGTDFLFKPEVKVGVVSRETGAAADAVLTATGYLESRRQSKIGARAAGRIQEIRVEEGDSVRKDTIIAVLEHADLDASLNAMKASLQRAKADLNEMKIKSDQDERDMRRFERLRERSSASEAELEAAVSRSANSSARCAALQASIAEREAMVEQVVQQLDNMIVRAPFSGTVISKDAELGESILPGGMGEASGRGSVITLADLDHLEVEADVKEDFINRLIEGQEAEVAVDAVPDQRYHGRLRKIIPMGDRARATIKVKIEITDVDKRLFPEMSATVFFMPRDGKPIRNKSEAVVLAPAESVRSDAVGDFVWQVIDNRLKRVRLELGDRRESKVVVKSGLVGGETVVLDPGADLRDKGEVKPAQ